MKQCEDCVWWGVLEFNHTHKYGCELPYPEVCIECDKEEYRRKAWWKFWRPK